MTITTASFPARGAANPDTRTGGREDIALDLQAQISALNNTGDANDAFESLATVASINLTGGQVARVNNISFTSGSRTVTLPAMNVATSAVEGRYYFFNNPGSFDYEIKNNGGTTIATADAGKQILLFLIDDSTANGSFAVFRIKDLPDETATYTGDNYTLTSASERMQRVSMLDFDQFVTLPSATTLEQRVSIYIIENTGEYSFGIKDNSGTILTYVQPGRIVTLTLADSTIAAGTWLVGDINPSPKYGELQVIESNAVNVTSVCRLDDNKAFVAYGRTAGGAGYCAVVDYTSGAPVVGTPAVIAASAFTGSVNTVFLDEDKILVTWHDGGTNHKARVASISGSTITYGTEFTIKGTNALNTMYAVKLEADVALVLYRYGTSGGTLAAVVVTVSGTTGTVNTPQDVHADCDNVVADIVDDSVILVLSTTTATTMYSSLLTVSGTTITVAAQNTQTIRNAAKDLFSARVFFHSATEYSMLSSYSMDETDGATIGIRAITTDASSTADFAGDYVVESSPVSAGSALFLSEINDTNQMQGCILNSGTQAQSYFKFVTYLLDGGIIQKQREFAPFIAAFRPSNLVSAETARQALARINRTTYVLFGPNAIGSDYPTLLRYKYFDSVNV